MTPHVGAVLYVAAGIGKKTIEDVSKNLRSFFGVLVLALFVITYLPDVTLWAPRMFGYEG
ncbi:MAG TPA: TRAP transporter large permease subunit [Chloroflexota bacterium]|nr:TRAP transporter large permease subunit [Chloroflexota bacterium]